MVRRVSGRLREGVESKIVKHGFGVWEAGRAEKGLKSVKTGQKITEGGTIFGLGCQCWGGSCSTFCFY